MKKEVLIYLANGFEEIEAVTPFDLLKRTGMDVCFAGVSGDSVQSCRGLSVKTHFKLEDVKDKLYDAVICPGGLPGADHLYESYLVRESLENHFKNDRLIAAICASPARVLSPLGYLDHKQATCFTGMESEFNQNVNYVSNDVVVDGRIITSRGAGTAFDFSVAIAKELGYAQKAEQLSKAMLFSK